MFVCNNGPAHRVEINALKNLFGECFCVCVLFRFGDWFSENGHNKHSQLSVTENTGASVIAPHTNLCNNSVEILGSLL